MIASLSAAMLDLIFKVGVYLSEIAGNDTNLNDMH